MLKCPFCVQEIPDAATVCPECGREIGHRRAPAPAAPTPAIAATPPIAQVSIVDINMPFASMVGFMVKWALAAIPALAILFALGLLVAAFASLR